MNTQFTDVAWWIVKYITGGFFTLLMGYLLTYMATTGYWRATLDFNRGVILTEIKNGRTKQDGKKG